MSKTHLWHYKLMNSFLCDSDFRHARFKAVKVAFYLPKKVGFICFNKSPFKMMNNAFYFVLKALFVLKKSTFFPDFFGYVGKRLDKKADVQFEIYELEHKQLQKTYCQRSQK